jgi:hypothetical protein
MPVVAVDEDGQLLGTMLRGLVGTSIGPFAQGCLDEAFGLAVPSGQQLPAIRAIERQ